MSRHVERCSRKLFLETAPASSCQSDVECPAANQTSVASSFAVVAALTRPRHKGETRESKLRERNEEEARISQRAAEVAARRASLYCLSRGAEKVVLDKWVLLGEGPGAFKKSK